MRNSEVKPSRLPHVVLQWCETCSGAPFVCVLLVYFLTPCSSESLTLVYDRNQNLRAMKTEILLLSLDERRIKL
jgi:hypothetical protein